MYINSAHEHIPKINAILSLLVNLLLIYAVHDDSKMKLGSYRVLLLFFALFNLTNTLADVLIPVCIEDFQFAFSIFITGGIFEKRSDLGALMICVRSGLVSASYGVLHCHFAYRYIALFARKRLDQYFVPFGILSIIAYCSLSMMLWMTVCYFWLNANGEERAYLRVHYWDKLGVDVYQVNMLVALYKGSDNVIFKSYLSVLLLSAVSLASVITDIILGKLIIGKLKVASHWMSKSALKQQKQFMKALIVQVIIPIVVSFLPCLFAWYKPMFGWQIWPWIDPLDTVATSFFPVLDPLALFYFVPMFRNRVTAIFGRELIKK